MSTFGTGQFGTGQFSGLTTGRIVVVDDAGASDALLLAGQRLPVTAFDDAGSGDTATLSRGRRIVRTDLVMVTDTVTINGLPALTDTGLWPTFDPGAEWIQVRDAALIPDTRHGTMRRDWSTASLVAVGGCSVQPYDTAETVEGREFTQTRRRLFAPAGTRLTATSRVVAHGVVYEVDGDPAVWRDLDGRPSHVEAVLKRLQG